MPSVAIINGYAFGGGLELALACTFRLATRNAKMGLPEIKLGLIPGYGGTQRLPRAVGEARALEMILTGRTVDAEEADRIGLVNRLIDGDPVAAGIAFAREFSGYSLPVLGLAREAVGRALDTPLNEGLGIEADLSHARVPDPGRRRRHGSLHREAPAEIRRQLRILPDRGPAKS